MATIETNKVLVLDVDAEGVRCAVNGENRRVDWHTLRRAARQDDKELRQVYRDILKQAEEKAAHGPVIVTVDQDSTNVWWVVIVKAVYGGGSAHYHRQADEGGTHANYNTAAWEAREIAKRLGKRATLRLS